MNVAIRQVRGKSGIDVWAENLCQGIHTLGHHCTLDLRSQYSMFLPSLLKVKEKNQHFDILHSNTWNGYAFKENYPLVVTEHHVIHDQEYSQYKTIPQKAYHRWIYECEKKSLEVADAVTCDSYYTLKKLEEVFHYLDAYLVYVGIDEKLFKPSYSEMDAFDLPQHKYLLFFAGNLSIRKGADLLPLIMKELGDDYLLLVSSGQKQGLVQGCRNILNLGRISLKRLIMTYNRCDIFLTPSRLEGFGLSVAEAMACGKPVIATNSSSLPELVVDGKGGFLCRMDNVKDFTEKIRLLADDKNLRRDMGVFNRMRVEEKFTVESMTKEYLDLYKKLTC